MTEAEGRGALRYSGDGTDHREHAGRARSGQNVFVGSEELSSARGHDVRRFLAEERGEAYFAYRTLQEARQAEDGAVILTGDYGGTVFLTAPARLVRCSEEALGVLVSDLDAVTWMSGDPTIATVTYECRPVGSGVSGGDGGGMVIEDVWVHPDRLPAQVGTQAKEVVQGQRQRIDAALLRRERERELARKRAVREANPPHRRECVRWVGPSTSALRLCHSTAEAPSSPRVGIAAGRISPSADTWRVPIRSASTGLPPTSGHEEQDYRNAQEYA